MAISGEELRHFLHESKTPVVDGKVSVLQERELRCYFLRLLEELRVMGKDTSCFSIRDFERVSGSLSPLVSNMLWSRFVKERDGQCFIDDNDAIKAVISDLLTEDAEFYFVEFQTLIEEGLRVTFESRHFQEVLRPALQSQELRDKVRQWICEEALILDYNDYCTPPENKIDEAQVKIKTFRHKRFTDLRLLLSELRKFKELFTLEEIRFYFGRFLQEKQLDSFLLKHFAKIVQPVRKDLVEHFRKFHGNPQFSGPGLSGYENIYLYRAKTIWINPSN